MDVIELSVGGYQLSDGGKGKAKSS